MRENVCSRLHALVKTSPQEAVDFRKVFESELFGVSLKQVSEFLHTDLFLEKIKIDISMSSIGTHSAGHRKECRRPDLCGGAWCYIVQR